MWGGALGRRASVAGVLAVLFGAVAAGQILLGAAPAAAEVCNTVNGPTTGPSLTITICLQAPEVGATLTGYAEVGATATVNPPGAAVIDRVNFWWGTGTSPAFLMADHDAPYSMQLDTTRLPNGPGVLRSRVVLAGGFATTRPSYNVSVSNPAPPPPDGETFEPWLGGPQEPGERVRMALVGDGVDGSPESHAVSDVIAAADPDVFAYLGDVYDRGTYHEFYNWYTHDPDGFGRFLDITNPAVGNHEYMESPTAAPYFEFWDEIPHYYSYDVGGWHVAVLDSTTEFAQLAPGTPQYEWLKADVAANKDKCTMMYAHHARYSNVTGVSRGGLQPVWELLVDEGADLIVAGHAHTYERWTPLDRLGQPTTEGITQLVVGTGGRPIINPKDNDSRVVTEATTPGALFLDLGPSDAEFSFVSANGEYTDSGTVPCRTPPTVESTVASTLPGDDDWHRGDVTVSWQTADPESPVTTTGCEPVEITLDQPETEYTCTATSGGGVTSKKVSVKRDGTAPVVTTAADPPAPDGTNGWYVSRPTVSFTCDDALSGMASCPEPVQPDEGISSIDRTGRDVAGNTTDVTFGPVQVDLTDPVVTCDEPPPTYLLHQTDALVGASITDSVSGPLRTTEVAPAPTTKVGDQTADVQGTDLAGRTSTQPCGFRVIYGFSGWSPPVDGGAVNVVKAGKVVPLKWQLADAAGLPVTTLSSARVTTVAHSCDTSGAPQAEVDEVAAGGSGLQNFDDGSYQYNWRTPTSYAGSCRTVQLDLGEDLLHTVEFRFTA